MQQRRNHFRTISRNLNATSLPTAAPFRPQSCPTEDLFKGSYQGSFKDSFKGLGFRLPYSRGTAHRPMAPTQAFRISKLCKESRNLSQASTISFQCAGIFRRNFRDIGVSGTRIDALYMPSSPEPHEVLVQPTGFRKPKNLDSYLISASRLPPVPTDNGRSQKLKLSSAMVPQTSRGEDSTPRSYINQDSSMDGSESSSR